RVCLALLAAQSRPALEVVVVDNGCVDDSAVLARAAGARVVREPRRGVPAAAAAGLDAAVGELL
ncbi:MAG TPA: glycosyl transferase, partial [Micrococcus luteus]|nr:glycosyl transferase [Micrococcus luteus]